MQAAVVIMSKIPQPGFTKTRLNEVLNSEESAAFHRVCLLDTCRAVIESTMPGHIYYLPQGGLPSPCGRGGPNQDLWGLPERERAYFQMCPQSGADLGERMYNAAQEVLIEHDAVILVGSDLPFITGLLLLEAQAALDDNDVVIGPAQDGGYYLLGCKENCPQLFTGIPWSTADVLEATLAVITENNLTCLKLPGQADIDTWDDLIGYYDNGRTDDCAHYRQLGSYQFAARLVHKYGTRLERS